MRLVTMNPWKRANLLAASLITAVFVLLSAWSLTRDAFRFDLQMATGKPLLGSLLTDLGIRHNDLPFAGMGPKQKTSDSAELPLLLASAMQLSGRDKWNALQQLVADYPDSPAAHAALARIACKNGGRVDVGHLAEQWELSPRSAPASIAVPTVARTRNQDDPRDQSDPVVMLRSCAAGERLDADNAYFPAMAAIAHYALHQDDAARAALHRAVQKPLWREYFEVEAEGRVRRAESLQGPQNSLTESVALAGMLFPHYAALRAMARVATAQAMHAERSGDDMSGLALRRDVARLGAKMREQSSALIGNLVGISLVSVSERRPGGAPLINSDSNDEQTTGRRTHDLFIEFLTGRNARADVRLWQRYVSAGEATKEIVQQVSLVSDFGAPTLFQTQRKLITNLLLLDAASLLCVLGGIAYVYPWLIKGTGQAAAGVAVTIFVIFGLWISWQALGNVRDIMAFSGVIQDLSVDSSSDPLLAQAQREAVSRTIYFEGSLGLLALLTLPIYLGLTARRAKRRRAPMGQLLRAGTLPLAALLTMGYAVHLVAFSLRERTVQAELQQVVKHEGRYIAAKLGKTWPDTQDEDLGRD